jgi:hypothetical protein
VAGNLSTKLPWELANPRWAASLNPLLSNPMVDGLLLNSVAVSTGANTINHGLGRKLQGYFVVMNSAAVTFYDSQKTNPRPDLTLVLNASGAATISLYVF